MAVSLHMGPAGEYGRRIVDLGLMKGCSFPKAFERRVKFLLLEFLSRNSRDV
jgi:hypothetical protein